MSSEPLAVRVCCGWAATYTRGLPTEIREHRVLEIESDLWEHLQDPGTADREILGRMLRGIHSDVWWRYRTLRESRGAKQGSHEMTTTRITQRWYVWLGIAVVLAGVGSGAIYIQENTEIVPDTAAWATFMLCVLGVMVTAGVGVVLGVLRLTNRHHTRSV